MGFACLWLIYLRGSVTVYTFAPIGVIRTVFQEKFGIPRQSLMVPAATGVVELSRDQSFLEAVQYLEGFSHIWLVFVFHEHLQSGWRAVIEPPRIGAPKGVGVFASRSPHRPNPIGMSVVELVGIDRKRGIDLHVRGVDLLDGTPILDIKPYIPYADSVPTASSGWLGGDIPRYPVEIDVDITRQLAEDTRHPNLVGLISEMLSYDPRPTPQKRQFPIEDPRAAGVEFAFRVLDLDVHWCVENGVLRVLRVLDLRV